MEQDELDIEDHDGEPTSSLGTAAAAVDAPDVEGILLSEDGLEEVDEPEHDTGVSVPPDLATVFGLAPAQSVCAYVDGLQAQCRASVQDAILQADARASRPYEARDIGLVDNGNGQVLFLYWISPSDKTGQAITLDNLNRIITIVPYRVPKLTLSSDAKIIIGNTGAIMMRVGRTQRPEMPEWLIIRQKLQQYQHFNGPLVGFDKLKSDAKPWQQCVVCTAALAHGLDPMPATASSDVYACSQCCSVWHTCCAQRHAASVGHTVDFTDRFMCGFCKALC